MLRLVVLLLLAAALLGAPAADARDARTDVVDVQLQDLPAEVRSTLALIKAGGPFRYRKDGSVFGNREKRLQRQPRGYYTEYTVPTPNARDRGARRIVAGRGTARDVASSGEYYYTDDHYNTFRRIRE